MTHALRRTLRVPAFLALLLVGAAVAEARGTVPDSPEAISPALIGSTVPDVEVVTLQGEPVLLGEFLQGQPTVLVFFRGEWWPYCDLQLGELQTIEPELGELGFRVVAVSPVLPEKISGVIDKHELTYELLTDAPLEAAQAMGLAWRLPEELVERYKGFGLDLEASSGLDHRMLPVPAVFLVDGEGLIHFTYVNPNHRVRLSSDVLLAAARAMAEARAEGD